MTCPKCDQDVRIGEWPFCPHGFMHGHRPSVHQSERAVRYYHPEHGWRTPGRADRPMPERLRKLGFQSVEFPSLRSLESHAKETGSRNELIDHHPSSHLAERQYNDRPRKNA